MFNVLYIAAGGKTDKLWLEVEKIYFDRLKHYINLEYIIIPSKSKESNPTKAKENENISILKLINPSDFVVILDEKGKSYNSLGFANFIEGIKLNATKRLVFITGGAYGFIQETYNRANLILQLSEMTFTHQMVRIIFLEQLYRACTILNRENYHH
jgi:23S rRNA (pseudouridine1915-N3)-methyltransferase